MNYVVYLLGAAAMVAVAMLGMAGPMLFRRETSVAAEASPFPSKVRDALRSLRALDEERRQGEIPEEDYEQLRDAAEARAVRALSDNDAEALIPEERIPRGRRAITAAVLVAVLGGLSGSALWASVRARDPGGVISGDLGPGASARAGDPLAPFEERVRRSPDDVAARLDLAHRLLDAGRAQQAVEHYLTALSSDPGNAEALAHLGYILFQANRPTEALSAVERALDTDSRYPEALLFKGLILLRGMADATGAIPAFEAYLKAAPYGSARSEAEALLKEARGKAGLG